MKQAQTIVDDLKASNIEIEPTKQMVAMIAYMHKLGKDIMPPPSDPAEVAPTSTAHADTSGVEIQQNEKEVVLLTSEADLAAAKAIYANVCAVCHGLEGKGIPPAFPDLTDGEWIHGNSPVQIFHSISEGNIAKGMIPYKNQYSEKQITQLTSYVLEVLNKK
jgi:mono/diheme cytochrome c family protein